jgi:hypothetical protein
MVEAGVGDQGGELMVRHAAGQGASVLGNNERGGFIEARNIDGKGVASMGVQENGGGRASVSTAGGQMAAVMDQGKDESGTVQIYAGGARLAALGGSGTGGLLNLFNLAGKAVVMAGTPSDGRAGMVSVNNENGSPAVTASALPDPEMTVFSSDQMRKRVITPPQPQ